MGKIGRTWLAAWAVGVLAIAGLGVAAAQGAAHSGAAVYDMACAACHNNPVQTRAPSLDALKAMSRQTIGFALSEGKMKMQGSGLTPREKADVIDWLAGPETAAAPAAVEDAWISGMMCPERTVDLAAAASVTGFGFDNANHRRLTRAQSGLATADFKSLELAWTIAFPKTTMMRSQPAVVGSTIFLPLAEAQRVLAIDVSGAKPCVKWAYKSATPLRTSAAFGEIAGRKVLALADQSSNVHLIDAATGAPIWKTHVGLSPLSITTGTPAISNGRVYAPISQIEIVFGGSEKYECCKLHGAVTALDGATGAKLWTGHTMEEAKPVRDRGDGKMLWGPSGAPIWTSPAIDEKRGLLYLGTGEANSEPAHRNTDAIIAFELKDGSIRWSFQATENDIFVGDCAQRPKGLNCPKSSVHRDVDFGASVIIAKGKGGKDVLLAGQKAGTVWALDPDTGALVWRQDFGQGSPLGGIHWGIAYDGIRVFAPINRPYGFGPVPAGGTQKPGMHAVEVATGEVAWTYAAQPDCAGDRPKRIQNCQWNIGLSAAPTVIDGAVVEGSIDGFVRAFDAKTGEVLWQYDTARSYEAVNGVKATGGSIDSASIVAANGYLLVSSGYSMFGQNPGNVLLGFRRK